MAATDLASKKPLLGDHDLRKNGDKVLDRTVDSDTYLQVEIEIYFLYDLNSESEFF